MKVFLKTFKLFFIFSLIVSTSQISFSQTNGTLVSNDYQGPRPTMLFLNITPDAKASAMGDLGSSTAADANSIYWNPGKLVSSSDNLGFAISYTPWMRNIVSDMALFNISGFKKSDDNQAFGFAINYFDLGTFAATTNTGQSNGNFSSAEYSVTGTYSRKLSDALSLGLNLKYINSNLSGNAADMVNKPASTVAADLGLYWNKLGSNNWSTSYGLVISNISGKVSYGGQSKNFIPTNLRLGITRSKEISEGNVFTYGLDVNKLMVPSVDSGKNLDDITAIGGMFSSIFQSPEAITTSIGAEYLINNVFAIRGGFFNESKNTGNRKYLSTGFGIKLDQKYSIDFAYLVPTNGTQSPLANTIRLSLVGSISQGN